MRADRHMSDVEAMMWLVDSDPHLSSTFGSLTLLDRVPDVDRLTRRMQLTVSRVPRLRQRVVPVFGRLGTPRWEDDADFAIERHVLRHTLPAPGNLRQLYDFATDLVQTPFDRERPLWEFVVVDGLADGRAALVQKMHHTITDGEGGIRISEQFIDVVRDAPDVAVATIPTVDAEPELAGVDAVRDALATSLRRNASVASRAFLNAGGLVRHPARLGSAGQDVVETMRSAVRQITLVDHAHSPLWTDRTLTRRLETLDIPFDDARAAAKALGGSLNDLFVTAIAGAAGAYHDALGLPIDTLRMAMPVSTRTDTSAGGNSFVPTRVLVPASGLDPIARFDAVHEVLHQTKSERVIGVVEPMAGLANLLPTSVVVRAARNQVDAVDFTTSNVRAAPFELFIAGGRIDATYALGPLGGTAFNATMMSYCGQLNVGLHLDAGAVGDPALLRACVVESFAELLHARR